MNNLTPHIIQLKNFGYTIVESVFNDYEISSILDSIASADSSKSTFRKSNDLFAIRQFLKEIPGVKDFVFNVKLLDLIKTLFGENYFVIKSIYFDKPEQSNWFVSYHQDLTISVDRKIELQGYGPWTIKQNQFAVQPPLHVLENIYTIRIHLDDTDENNGALNVIPGSHGKSIYRPETIDWNQEKPVTCKVPKGGIMIMRPLLLHSSQRTTNGRKRRVIHIEFSNLELPEAIQWAEKSIF